MIETANLNGLEAIPESSSFGDPLGVASSSSYHDDPEESDEDLLIWRSSFVTIFLFKVQYYTVPNIYF